MRRILFAITLELLTSCDDLKATRAAGVRRVAEGRLAICARNHRCIDMKLCLPALHDFCRDAGLEPTCGEGYQSEPLRCGP